MLVDTHCHLNDFKAFPDLQAEIDYAKSMGVGRMIVVGVKPEEWESTLEMAQSHSELFCILGWHPNYTADYDPDRLLVLERLGQSPKCLAVGEIGLDYHWDYSPPDVQKRALLDQLDLASRLGKPVVFHAREAYSDLLDLLESRPRLPYLFHCFAGSLKEAQRAAALDAYFGVDGPITYKRSGELREVVASIPRERLVIETDAPYLSPEPMRGQPNRPGNVVFVNRRLAEILQIDDTTCGEIVTSNAVRFFGESLIS